VTKWLSFLRTSIIHHYHPSQLQQRELIYNSPHNGETALEKAVSAERASSSRTFREASLDRKNRDLILKYARDFEHEELTKDSNYDGSTLRQYQASSKNSLHDNAGNNDLNTNPQQAFSMSRLSH